MNYSGDQPPTPTDDQPPAPTNDQLPTPAKFPLVGHAIHREENDKAITALNELLKVTTAIQSACSDLRDMLSQDGELYKEYMSQTHYYQAVHESTTLIKGLKGLKGDLEAAFKESQINVQGAGEHS
jgi:hypothetical protein